MDGVPFLETHVPCGRDLNHFGFCFRSNAPWARDLKGIVLPGKRPFVLTALLHIFCYLGVCPSSIIVRGSLMNILPFHGEPEGPDRACAVFWSHLMQGSFRVETGPEPAKLKPF